jgi:hypothetical protein
MQIPVPIKISHLNTLSRKFIKLRESNVEDSEAASKKSRAGYLLHPTFFLGLFLDPEDGGDMFRRNVG